MAVLSPSDVAKVVVARNQQFHSFRDVPDEAFPLFLSSKQWLSMLDATVPEPFLRWEPCLVHACPTHAELLCAQGQWSTL